MSPDWVNSNAMGSGIGGFSLDEKQQFFNTLALIQTAKIIGSACGCVPVEDAIYKITYFIAIKIPSPRLTVREK